MNLDDIRPFVRGASVFNWNWNNREFTIAYDCRIFAITNGEAILRANSGEYRLKNGAVMFFNAAKPYHFRAADTKPFRFIVINLDLTHARIDVASFVQPDSQSNFKPENVIERLDIPELDKPVIIPDESGLKDRVAELFEEYHGDGKYRDARMTAIATDIIINAVRLSAAGSSRGSKVIAAAKSFIHEHYGERISNIEIAAKLGYHPYYLSRLFSRETGLSLHKYLNEYRLRAALHLLTISSEPIERIAESCGFSSPAHFTAAFKTKYGRLPSSYRRDN